MGRIWTNVAPGTTPPPGTLAINAANLNAMEADITAAKDGSNIGIVIVAAPTGSATTDTANIQNALNQSTNGNPKRIILQAGTYQLNAALSVPFAPGTAIIGQGPLVTALRQSNGLHVFTFTTDLTHTITVEGIDVGYSTAQTTSCAAFYYHVTGGTSGGFFNHVYRDLFLTNCYDGFRLEDADGQQTIWNTSWYNVRTSGALARSFMRLAPQTAIGMPELNLYQCGSFQTPTVAGAQCFVFTACEVSFYGVGVENYIDTAFYASGGGHLNIYNLHVESHKFNAGTSQMVICNSNTPVYVDGFSISGANASSNNAQVVLFALSGAGGAVTAKNGSHNVTTSNGTPYVTEFCWGGSGVAGIRTEFANIIKSGGGVNSPLTGSRGSQLAEYTKPRDAVQYRSVTGNYSHQQNDAIITVNATAAATVTLLDPTTCMVGVPVTVKNVTANTVTVQSAGTSKTIDGAASTTLAQWAKAMFVSDGTQWLSV